MPKDSDGPICHKILQAKSLRHHLKDLISAQALMVGTNPKVNYVQTRQLATKKCVYCQGNHWSDECPRYRTIRQRKERIKGRCSICFGSKHLLRECPSDRQCVYCKRAHNHHRSLCPEKFPKGENEAATVKSEERPVVQVNDTSVQMQENEAKQVMKPRL